MSQNKPPKKYTIKVTVLLEKAFWVGIFESNDNESYAVARKIFGAEPSDAELYNFVLAHYHELKFSEPHEFRLVIKRKNPKRLQREVRQEMDRARKGLVSTTHAQEVLRLELEKKKKIKKVISKNEKEIRQEEKFRQKQDKKKKKQRGH